MPGAFLSAENHVSPLILRETTWIINGDYVDVGKCPTSVSHTGNVRFLPSSFTRALAR